MPLNPIGVNEEVKEMKSVDEETNKDDEDSDDGKGFGDLHDINDIATPPKQGEEISFRDKDQT